MNAIRIEYRLRPPGEEPRRIPLDFTIDDFRMLVSDRDEWPEWTRLDHEQCDHCPLDPAGTQRCPLAARLVDIVEATGDLVSHQRLEAEVVSNERRCSFEASAGDALRSLMGLVIPCSGCPVTAFFRPMARFHLPFSSQGETLYRVCAMYRLAQHYRGEAGLEADPAFDRLSEIYKEINRVNMQVTERLRSAAGRDSSRNAMALLDVFAQLLPLSFEQAIEEMKPLFDAYLE